MEHFTLSLLEWAIPTSETGIRRSSLEASNTVTATNRPSKRGHALFYELLNSDIHPIHLPGCSENRIANVYVNTSSSILKIGILVVIQVLSGKKIFL